MVSTCRNDDLYNPLARRLQAVTRESSARLVEAMIEQAPWRDHMHARVALAIAARAIRRGRHLTDDARCLSGGLIAIREAPNAQCDCGAATEGKWANVHSKDCAVILERNEVLEQTAKIAEEIDACEGHTYDNGFTEDGYRQAKSQIADAIRKLKD